MAVWRTLVVGTDGSETADRAVARAVEIATAMGARLIVAHAGDPEQGRAVLARTTAQHATEGLELETALVQGDPAEALLGLAGAEHADAIVVGNKGMSGAQRFLLGSVPNKVSHRAGCDVIIVATVTDGG